jgi:hypothetical protein
MALVHLTTVNPVQFAAQLAQTQQIVSHVTVTTESLRNSVSAQVMAISITSTWQIQAPTRVRPAQYLIV